MEPTELTGGKVLADAARLTSPASQKGGKVLGEGFKGRVIDTDCAAAAPSLCSVLSSIDPATLITLHKTQCTVLVPAATVLRSLRDMEDSGAGIVTKEFHRPLFRASSSREHFNAELESMRRIYAALGSSGTRRYTTLAPVRLCGVYVFGLHVPGVGNYTLQRRAAASVPALLREGRLTEPVFARLIGDMLAAIARLQRAHLFHGDLKWSNMMLGPDGEHFVLVDWDMSRDADDLRNAYIYGKTKPFGAMAYSSPLCHYLWSGRVPWTLMIFAAIKEQHELDVPLGIRTITGPYARYIKDVVRPAYYAGLDPTASRGDLFDRTSKTFELFSLGMSLLMICHCRGGPRWEVFGPFIERLLLLNGQGFRTAEEAVGAWRAFVRRGLRPVEGFRTAFVPGFAAAAVVASSQAPAPSLFPHGAASSSRHTKRRLSKKKRGKRHKRG